MAAIGACLLTHMVSSGCLPHAPDPPAPAVQEFSTWSDPPYYSAMVLAVCGCDDCWGDSARPNDGKFAAADPRWPIGSMASIPGYNDGQPVPVLARSAGATGSVIVVFIEDHDQAQAWEIRLCIVEIHPLMENDND